MSARLGYGEWETEEAPAGVFVSADGPDLLGLPEGVRLAKRAAAFRPLEAHGRATLAAFIAALDQCAMDTAASPPISLGHLSAEDRAGVLDLLGEGEVSALIATADGLIQAQETIFPGLWVLRRDDDADAPWLEVGPAPASADTALAAVQPIPLPLEHIVPPDGAMNVMGVLAEVRHRSKAWRPGDPNHIMNFTLLPMTEADAAFLALILGQGPVRFSSGGYGSARVICTAVPHVWAVQYLNAMGLVILDTLEIGAVPQAALAQREDFEDSAARLRELLQGGWA
jgi:hydrogenase-1 operon protein HyaF